MLASSETAHIGKADERKTVLSADGIRAARPMTRLPDADDHRP